MVNLELSPPVFSILSGLIEERVGLHYGVIDKDLLRDKASARAIDAGFTSLLDYYYFLRYDSQSEQELSDLVETLVVNETYFFREWPAILALVEYFIAPLCASGQRVRIWSAACATGEEPLSLAMLLEQKKILDQVEIVASDISARVLANAQRNQFSKRSVRNVPDPSLLANYISQTENGYRVSPHLIGKIRWEQQNLLRFDDYRRLGIFDIIICRNVLIYFSDATNHTVLRGLSTSLKPSGILAVGVSESLLRYGNIFIGEEHGGSFFYRKPEEQ